MPIYRNECYPSAKISNRDTYYDRVLDPRVRTAQQNFTNNTLGTIIALSGGGGGEGGDAGDTDVQVY